MPPTPFKLLENFEFSALFWPEFQLSRRKFSKCSFPRPLIFFKRKICSLDPTFRNLCGPINWWVKNFTTMKNILIDKNNNIFKKKRRRKKEVLHDFFLQQFYQQNPVKITVKHYFYIGLYLIFTLWSRDLQRRPTKFGRAYAFFSSLFIKMNGSLITCHFKHYYFILFYFILVYFILFYCLLLSLQEFDGRILPGKSFKNIRFCSPILLDHGKD